MADTVNKCNVKAEGGWVWFDEEKAAKDCAATLGAGYNVVAQGSGSDETRYSNRTDHYIVTAPTLADVEKPAGVATTSPTTKTAGDYFREYLTNDIGPKGP